MLTRRQRLEADIYAFITGQSKKTVKNNDKAIKEFAAGWAKILDQDLGVGVVPIEFRVNGTMLQYRNVGDSDDEWIDLFNFSSLITTIAVGGIASITETERLALVPTSALIVEDITLDQYFRWSTLTNSWTPM